MNAMFNGGLRCVGGKKRADSAETDRSHRMEIEKENQCVDALETLVSDKNAAPVAQDGGVVGLNAGKEGQDGAVDRDMKDDSVEVKKKSEDELKSALAAKISNLQEKQGDDEKALGEYKQERHDPTSNAYVILLQKSTA